MPKLSSYDVRSAESYESPVTSRSDSKRCSEALCYEYHLRAALLGLQVLCVNHDNAFGYLRIWPFETRAGIFAWLDVRILSQQKPDQL